MKKKFLTVALAATASLLGAFSAFAATEDKEVYSTDKAYQLDGDLTTADSIDNPLLNVETDKITVEYSLTSSHQLAAWNGLAQFYNTSGGVAHLGFWPQICLNDWSGNWAELAAETIYADTLADGKEHVYKYVITSSSIEIYVDGQQATIAAIKGNSDTCPDIASACKALFNFMTSAEKFSLGYGHTAADWWGELDSTSTINSFKISAQVEAEDEEESTTSPSMKADDEIETEEPTTSPSMKTDDEIETEEPTEEPTTSPSPKTDDAEVVKATVVTADAAKAISDAAKITSQAGDLLDAKLTATPVEDTTVAAGLVNADEALQAAKVKAWAVLDLKLMVGDKNVTLLDEKINVNIPMDKIFSDIKADAVVAVYRIDNGALSFLGTSKVLADKTITFATEHFSQYVFAVVENADALKDVKVVEYVKDIDTTAKVDTKVADIPVLKDAAVTPDSNKTGDTSPIMPLVILAVVALGAVAVVVVSKKRA